MTKDESINGTIKTADHVLQETIKGTAFDGTEYEILVYPKNSFFLKFTKMPTREIINIVKSLGGKWNGRFKNWMLGKTTTPTEVQNFINS